MTAPLIEAIARAMWNDRERTFPPFTRMKWENGTDIARETTTGYVAAVVRALDTLGYAIVPREPTLEMQAHVRTPLSVMLDTMPLSSSNLKAAIAAGDITKGNTNG